MVWFKEGVSIISPLLKEWRTKFSGQNRRYLQELLWLSLGQGGTLLLSVISIKLITTIGTHDYGIYILLTSITSIWLAAFYTPYQQSYVATYLTIEPCAQQPLETYRRMAR